MRGREKVGSKYFSRRGKGNSFIWMDLKSSVVGEMKGIFLVGYRRESGFYLFRVPKRLTQASRMP